MKACQECVEPRVGNDRVRISYNNMMIYRVVSQIYSASDWIHLHYPSSSVHHKKLTPTKLNSRGGDKGIVLPTRPPSTFLSSLNWHLQVLLQLCSSTAYIYIERLRYYLPYYYVTNFVTVIMANVINEIPCGYGTVRTTAMREYGTRSPTERCRDLSCSRCLAQPCAEVLAAFKVTRRLAAEISAARTFDYHILPSCNIPNAPS